MINFHEIGLISRMRAGRPDAYKELYDTYVARLMGYARQLSGDRGEAEDLVQETILAAWKGRDTFHGNAKLLSWLLGIMSRRWRDRCRHRRVATVSIPMQEGETEPSIAVDPGTGLETEVINRVMMDEALAALELPLREALLLIRSHPQNCLYRLTQTNVR